jgi:hypothetical protein
MSIVVAHPWSKSRLACSVLAISGRQQLTQLIDRVSDVAEHNRSVLLIQVDGGHQRRDADL